MFWDKNYLPSQNIEALLEKEDVTVEEFLDEDDIIQECKSQKKNLVNYFTQPNVVKRLVELITTEPSEDLPMNQRFRHANVASEILTIGIPSLDEKLLADEETLNNLYSYLEKEPPLNPLLASYFSKTLSMLFTKKSEQDWFLYQQMCLQLLEYIKSKSNFLNLICTHFTTPVIPDLIMDMMRNVEGKQLKINLYDWLIEERLVEKLIDVIGDPMQCEKHANVAEFLCDLIQFGRTMRQSDQDNDGFEPTFEGSNPILKNIESATTLLALFNVILQPNAQESAIVSGITVVLKIIRPVMMVDERNSDRLKFIQDREKEIHEELLSTVIRVIEPQLKYFNELLRNPPNKSEITISTGKLSPPFGMTRLQICRLFTVLLQTNNEEMSRAICETDFFNTLLTLFKEYCWNNFLHSEVEKCLHTIFYSALANNNNNNSTHVSDGSHSNIFIAKNNISLDESNNFTASGDKSKPDNSGTGNQTENLDNNECENASEETAEQSDKQDDADITKIPADADPSEIQSHVIINCKLIGKLIECWKINKEIESAEKGRRLGYMGHLIKIFKHITSCISESKHIGALIENNLKDDEERDLWTSIVNTTDGELTNALNTQAKLLANYNTDEDCSFKLALEFLNDNILSCDDDAPSSYRASLEEFGLSNDDEDEDEENASTYSKSTSLLQPISVTSNPWNINDDFDVMKSDGNNKPWTTDFGSNNFADFDAYFCSFANDMGQSLTATKTSTTAGDNDNTNDTPVVYTNYQDGFSTSSNIATSNEEYDNNANVEKTSWSGDFSTFQLPKKDTQKQLQTFSTSNFIDDYEDDEGMWTKPLGGSSNLTVDQCEETEEEEEQQQQAQNATDDNKLLITNGPWKSSQNEDNEDIQKTAGSNKTATNELNNSTEDNSHVTSTTDITTATLETTDNEKGNSIMESNDAMHKLNSVEVINCINDESVEKKLNNVEVTTSNTPPNTT